MAVRLSVNISKLTTLSVTSPLATISMLLNKNAERFETVPFLIDYVLNRADGRSILHKTIAVNYCLLSQNKEEINKMIHGTESEWGDFMGDIEESVGHCAKHNLIDIESFLQSIAKYYNNYVNISQKSISFKDVRQKSCRHFAANYDLELIAFLLIYMIYSTYDDLAYYYEESMIQFLLFMFLRVGSIVNLIPLLEGLYYVYHILPYIGEIDELNWSLWGDDEAVVIANIDSMYECMMFNKDEIKAIGDCIQHNFSSTMHKDVCGIIRDYTIYELPEDGDLERIKGIAQFYQNIRKEKMQLVEILPTENKKYL